MIAVCDHNTAGNVEAVRQAAEASGGRLAVFPGMEISSAEEVHVVGLFPDLPAAESVTDRIGSLLPPADRDYYSFFGEQPLMDAEGRCVEMETASLAMAVPLDMNETVELIHSHGGLAIAAHIDRKSFSVFSQLGFFPPDAGFDGVEVSRHVTDGSPRLEEFSALGPPVFGASDSHFLDEIGTCSTTLVMAEPTFAELALAIAGVDSRSVSRA